MPSIAVVIPTRNRGSDAADAARAVLASDVDLELVVVDQSTNDDTSIALDSINDRRLTVIRTGTVGISNSRNIGVSATTAPIIAFTDDDCRPRPDWAEVMLRTFDGDPRAAIVFGKVVLPATDGHDFAPAFDPVQRIQEGRMIRPGDDMGIGASFAIRRDVIGELGGFDPLLGAGAPFFRGAEETDVLVRALHVGRRVVNTIESPVLHLGVRSGSDARDLVVAYQRATGAAFAKHARLDGIAGWVDCLRWVTGECSSALRGVRTGRRASLGPIVHFAAGAMLSLRYRVDRESRRFVARS